MIKCRSPKEASQVADADGATVSIHFSEGSIGV